MSFKIIAHEVAGHAIEILGHSDDPILLKGPWNNFGTDVSISITDKAEVV